MSFRSKGITVNNRKYDFINSFEKFIGENIPPSTANTLKNLNGDMVKYWDCLTQIFLSFLCSRMALDKVQVVFTNSTLPEIVIPLVFDAQSLHRNEDKLNGRTRNFASASSPYCRSQYPSPTSTSPLNNIDYFSLIHNKQEVLQNKNQTSNVLKIFKAQCQKRKKQKYSDEFDEAAGDDININNSNFKSRGDGGGSGYERDDDDNDDDGYNEDEDNRINTEDSYASANSNNYNFKQNNKRHPSGSNQRSFNSSANVRNQNILFLVSISDMRKLIFDVGSNINQDIDGFPLTIEKCKYITKSITLPKVLDVTNCVNNNMFENKGNILNFDRQYSLNINNHNNMGRAAYWQNQGNTGSTTNCTAPNFTSIIGAGNNNSYQFNRMNLFENYLISDGDCNSVWNNEYGNGVDLIMDEVTTQHLLMLFMIVDHATYHYESLIQNNDADMTHSKFPKNISYSMDDFCSPNVISAFEFVTNFVTKTPNSLVDDYVNPTTSTNSLTDGGCFNLKVERSKTKRCCIKNKSKAQTVSVPMVITYVDDDDDSEDQTVDDTSYENETDQNADDNNDENNAEIKRKLRIGSKIMGNIKKSKIFKNDSSTSAIPSLKMLTTEKNELVSNIDNMADALD